MPFKSKAQQRFMFAAEDRGELPKGTAKEWADATEKKKGGIEALPEKVKSSKKTAGEMAEFCLEAFSKEAKTEKEPLSVLERIMRLRNSKPEDWLDYYSVPDNAAQLEPPEVVPNRFVEKIKGIPSAISSGFSDFGHNMKTRPKFRRNVILGTMGTLGAGGGLALGLGAMGKKTPEENLMPKVAYNPAKDYWDSTWWGRSADRKKRKADAQEELLKELGNLSPEELQARLGKKASLASQLSKQAFWGRKKIKVWDPEELYEEQRKTETPEQLLDTDLYNALYMANQGMGTGLLHRKGFKYPEPGKDMLIGDYKSRIAGLKPEQKQFISEILWGAQPTPGKTASTRSIVMKKSAAEIAEKVCTPEEKAKCCKGEGESDKKEEKKDEKKEEKKEEKSEGNPFAKKDETSENKGFPFEKKEAASCGSSGKPMPKKKGFKPFPKKNIKKASDIADMILQKNAASSTDFIDKMRSKADKGLDATSRAAGKGLDATSRAAKSVVKKKDEVEGALRSKASKGVDAVNKGVNKASKKLKSVIEKKSSAKLAADVLKMSTPPLPKPIPQTPEVKQMKAQMSAPMPWEKSAATRWEQVFRESPEILENAIRKRSLGDTHSDLVRMKEFMQGKDRITPLMDRTRPLPMDYIKAQNLLVRRDPRNAVNLLGRKSLDYDTASPIRQKLLQQDAINAVKGRRLENLFIPGVDQHVAKRITRSMAVGPNPNLPREVRRIAPERLMGLLGGGRI